MYSLGFEECERIIKYAIECKSSEMTQYYGDKEQNLSTWDIDNALANAGSVEMYRYFHNLGYSVSMDCLVVDNEHPITDFEVIKFCGV